MSFNKKNREKICLITSVFSPYTKGGAETVVNNIVNGFKKTKYQIFVITLCPFIGIKSLWPKKYNENGIIIYRFYTLNLFSYLNINKYKNKTLLRLIWHGLDIFNLHSYFIIKHILKKEKPEVIMTHMLKGVGYLTPLAIKSLKTKHIHTLHELQLITPSGLILKGEEDSWQHNFFLTKLYQWINRLLFSSPLTVISSSKFLLDFHNSRGFFPNSRKIILTNPIVIKNQESRIKNQELTINQQYNNKFIFLFLGQIEKYKGILLLIDVFKKLLQQVDDKFGKVELLIVGTGSTMQDARMLARDEKRIKFLGFIPNQKLDTIFIQVNATIVPSLCYENSPTVIFESLSYGVPVLAASIGGIEFIKDNYNGFTFEAGDTNDLLRVLKFSLENKDKLKRMTANAKESIKGIGVGKYIEKLIAIFY